MLGVEQDQTTLGAVLLEVLNVYDLGTVRCGKLRPGDV